MPRRDPRWARRGWLPPRHFARTARVIRDSQGRAPLTTAEAAAFLGVSPGAIRQIVRRHHIAAVGKRGRAKVYWMHEIARHAGAHDRQRV